MPLFDYLCVDCGKVTEVLLTGPEDLPRCGRCGSLEVKRLLSAHSSLSGASKGRMPGAGDTGCCGSQPHQADCNGPGSCCGKGR